MKTRRAVTIDDLLGMDPDQLLELYRAARTPAVADLDGRLQGRMLAVPRAQEPHVSRWLRALAGTLWQGKTFEHHDSMHGEGVNRVLGEKLNWFHFETEVGPSRAGDFDALQLNYDHHGNPPLVRSVKDEVREVAPGLWLGLAYLQEKDGDHLGCFFAVARP
ncbi:MAG TPA: hypothetical protein VIO84_05270 [Candidatus Dormibacteraeota bacterium]|jgi:hypothetical protein